MSLAFFYNKNITNEKMSAIISENVLSQNYLEVGVIDTVHDSYTRFYSQATNISQFNNSSYEDSVERIVKTGFRTKTAAKEWADKMISVNYTERVPKNQGYRGNRYKIDKIIINYNDATSENVELLSKIFC